MNAGLGTCGTRTKSCALVALASILLASGGCAGQEGGGSGGGCAAPFIVSAPEEASPGGELALHGEGFIDGCVDGAANGTPVGTASPYDTVEVVVIQAGEILLSQSAEPDDEGYFDLTVQLPSQLGVDPLTITTPDIVAAETLTLDVATN